MQLSEQAICDNFDFEFANKVEQVICDKSDWEFANKVEQLEK